VTSGELRCDRSARPMGFGALRHQGGFVRGAIVLFALLTLVGAFVLDILSVYTAHHMLDGQTQSAAKAAAASYVQYSSDGLAEQEATQYLSDHGSTLVKIVPDHANGLNVYTVSAKRPVKTYLLRFFAKLPAIGGWIDRQLHPVVTGDNTQ
jgi:hypothetical protein